MWTKWKFSPLCYRRSHRSSLSWMKSTDIIAYFNDTFWSAKNPNREFLRHWLEKPSPPNNAAVTPPKPEDRRHNWTSRFKRRTAESVQQIIWKLSTVGKSFINVSKGWGNFRKKSPRIYGVILTLLNGCALLSWSCIKPSPTDITVAWLLGKKGSIGLSTVFV